ncbi:MAG: hypothetical protein LBQ40_06060 [Clostridiales bacterium]|jgi:hypothetical protein|nr:hypothetical protein [Clostridiales bacterium]
MIFKSDLSAEEFKAKYSADGGGDPRYSVGTGARFVRIKRRGYRYGAFSAYGKIIEKEPLKLRFFDAFAVRFAVIYSLLIIFELFFDDMDAAAAALLSAAVFTALYVAAKFNSGETARMLINDFKFELVVEKERYNVPYNYFYFYLLIIYSLIYPAYVLTVSVFGLPEGTGLIITVAAAALATAALAATKNFTELFFIDREGIIRQNVFVARDKLFYSANDIESVTVVNKDLKGRDKETAFSFEIKIKEKALYRPANAFYRLKEKDTIHLPYSVLTAAVIKIKLGFDVDDKNYEEFFR